ncbi:hypothetical protein ABTE84_21230, partial [Acinetobacter baumannii]
TIRWYVKAAQSGIAYAWCSAGEIYIEGRLLPRNLEQGLALCVRAAQADSSPAMLRLGDYFREGRQVPQDLERARYWYQQ